MVSLFVSIAFVPVWFVAVRRRVGRERGGVGEEGERYLFYFFVGAGARTLTSTPGHSRIGGRRLRWVGAPDVLPLYSYSFFIVGVRCCEERRQKRRGRRGVGGTYPSPVHADPPPRRACHDHQRRGRSPRSGVCRPGRQRLGLRGDTPPCKPHGPWPTRKCIVQAGPTLVSPKARGGGAPVPNGERPRWSPKGEPTRAAPTTPPLRRTPTRRRRACPPPAGRRAPPPTGPHLGARCHFPPVVPAAPAPPPLFRHPGDVGPATATPPRAMCRCH